MSTPNYNGAIERLKQGMASLVSVVEAEYGVVVAHVEISKNVIIAFEGCRSGTAPDVSGVMWSAVSRERVEFKEGR